MFGTLKRLSCPAPRTDRGVVFDVGMHDGSDTAFYLGKGFRVVAVEANPDLVKLARARFAAEIASGRLTIVDKAVGSAQKRIPFFVHRKSDWSATTRPSEWKNEDVKRIEVDCVPLDEIIRQYEVPHYLKIDIEGSDLAAVKSLARVDILPTYISAEAHAPEVALALYELGYRDFKLIDQGSTYRPALPWVPREGVYFYQHFTGQHSGAFGEETPGNWRSLDVVLAEFAVASPASWYDFHARLRPPAPRPRRLADFQWVPIAAARATWRGAKSLISEFLLRTGASRALRRLLTQPHYSALRSFILRR